MPLSLKLSPTTFTMGVAGLETVGGGDVGGLELVLLPEEEAADGDEESPPPQATSIKAAETTQQVRRNM
ncbi:hypothetical protein [Hydrogenophaga sp.]|uniref:hypothetical protein n=1 Tax=Hydrogenophaga sp. TaxID=1904254 RepID=UPI002728E343|nr:hypothetical protein [Hydrogenophaga sp.]MDO9436073.1 hypothetical protein [Hydrogenophaga sp.]